MDLEITKRDQLLQKASQSIQILSKENESLQNILTQRNDEIIKLQQKNARVETDLNSLQKEYNESMVKSARQLQNTVSQSGLFTPSNITNDTMYINQLNSIDLKNQQQTSQYKKQLQTQFDEQQKLLEQKIDLLKQENKSIKLNEQNLRKLLDESNDQGGNYRKEVNQNNDELRNLRAIQSDFKFLSGKHDQLQEQYTKVFNDFQQVFQNNEKHATECQNLRFSTQQLQQDLKQYQQKSSQLEVELNSVQQLKFELQTQHDLDAVNIQSSESQIIQLSQENSTIKLNQAKLNDENERQLAEITSQLQQIQNYELQLKQLENNIRDQTQKVQSQIIDVDTGNQAKEELVKQKSIIQSLQSENNNSIENYNQVNQHYFELKQKFEQQSFQLQEQAFQSQQYQQQIDSLNELNIRDKSTIDAFIDKITETEQQLQQINIQKSQIAAQLESNQQEQKTKIETQSTELNQYQTRVQAFDNQIKEKNQRILDLTEQSSNFDIQQKLLQRLMYEIATECMIDNPIDSNSRENSQLIFQKIVGEIKSKNQQIKEAQQLLNEYQNATEQINEKILKQEQLLKMARDDIETRIANENSLIASINELQKQVNILDQENTILKQKIENEDSHKSKLKQYVNDCKHRIQNYENQSSEYYSQLKYKEENIDKQVYNLQKSVSQNITEFSQSILSKLRNGDKESAISDILKLHKTFMI
ncbi:hypothetical protein SS50377_24400 [Spironucleus salmonicida]|uniref:Uncharacterized protein n=1 Tax=Spironucleus salmonicida TaxID=348837 RepID=V6LN49_9EUKA|nr:hypothetical protein SS50377_24400 [Spironucleus salmonicida]|eukprot:EST46050.1 Hypothetical protein SS50377_14040 [Spironucleus salmonicida]